MVSAGSTTEIIASSSPQSFPGRTSHSTHSAHLKVSTFRHGKLFDAVTSVQQQYSIPLSDFRKFSHVKQLHN